MPIVSSIFGCGCVGCNEMCFADRDEMKLTQKDFTGLPADLVGLVMGGVAVAMLGENQTIGSAAP